MTGAAGHLTPPGPGQRTGPGCPKPLVPGRLRVHGAPGGHRAVNTSDGYTVSVHLRAHPAQ